MSNRVWMFVGIDDCASYPCMNDGECVDGHLSYTCDHCAVGYHGLNCHLGLSNILNVT